MYIRIVVSRTAGPGCRSAGPVRTATFWPESGADRMEVRSGPHLSGEPTGESAVNYEQSPKQGQSLPYFFFFLYFVEVCTNRQEPKNTAKPYMK